MSARYVRRSSGTDWDMIIGIILIVLGVLALVGSFSIGNIIYLAAIAAIVVGVLILAKVVAGSQASGVVLLVVGILLLVLRFDLNFPSEVRNALDIILGVLLIIFGALKLMHRW